MPINLDFGFVVFLCLLTVGAIVIGVFLGKRFTKTSEPTKTVRETVEDFPAAILQQPSVIPPPPAPPPTYNSPKETLAEKSKKILENQKKQVKEDFEGSLLSNMGRGNYSFASRCKSYDAMPKELTVKVLRRVIDEFEKANPTLVVDANFKYSSSYNGNMVSVHIKAKG